MPLSTQIVRDGVPMQLRWGDFHVAAMALASSFEQGTNAIGSPDLIYENQTFPNYPEEAFPITQRVAFVLTDYGALSKTPLIEGSYTLTKRHKFVDTTDGEVLELLPGDVLWAYR